MIAKFENQTLSDGKNLSVHKYRNLQNLPHWHMECELIFAETGTAQVTVDSESYRLEGSSFAFVRSGAIHNISSSSENIITVVKIDQSIIEHAFGSMSPVYPLLQFSDISVHDLMDELIRYQNSGLRYGNVICDSILLQLLAEVFSRCDMTARPYECNSEKFKSLLSLIEQQYADITFEQAAEFMCFSKPYFSKYFSRISGISFSSYLNIIRTEKAIAMINEGRLSITEIAHNAGFGTIRHFNRTFKELTGYSPGSLPKDYVFVQYRKSGLSEGYDPTLSSPAIL